MGDKFSLGKETLTLKLLIIPRSSGVMANAEREDETWREQRRRPPPLRRWCWQMIDYRFSKYFREAIQSSRQTDRLFQWQTAWQEESMIFDIMGHFIGWLSNTWRGQISHFAHPILITVDSWYFGCAFLTVLMISQLSRRSLHRKAIWSSQYHAG